MLKGLLPPTLCLKKLYFEVSFLTPPRAPPEPHAPALKGLVVHAAPTRAPLSYGKIE